MAQVASALVLTVVEARVLGCLFEKQRTVADQYPLTLKALVGACNQATSREPVMHLSDHEVESAITSLKTSGLARLVHPSHGRSATRYRQVADEAWQLELDASALVAVLLLRGPQTVAELRTRTERMHPFASLDDVESTLAALATRGLVQQIPRQPGQKEPRWQQLLAHESVAVHGVSGSVESAQSHVPVEHAVPGAWVERDGSSSAEVAAPAEARQPVVVPAAMPDRARVDEADDLRARVAELEARLAHVEAALADLL